jgi:hypothetical protein
MPVETKRHKDRLYSPHGLPHPHAKNRRANAAWDKLSYTHQKEHAEAIAGAKRPEAVEARVKKAMELLLSKASVGASTLRSTAPRKAK